MAKLCFKLGAVKLTFDQQDNIQAYKLFLPMPKHLAGKSLDKITIHRAAQLFFGNNQT